MDGRPCQATKRLPPDAWRQGVDISGAHHCGKGYTGAAKPW